MRARSLSSVMRYGLLAAVLSTGGLHAQDTTPPIHADVQLLLQRETRDEAFARIVARGVYRGPGDYVESSELGYEVRHVILCPQAEGAPLFAVFIDEIRAPDPPYVVETGQVKLEIPLQFRWLGPGPHVPRGHIAIVASDGALIRLYAGANVVHGKLEDINADGILDYVESTGAAVGDDLFAQQLWVLPITEEMQPSLRVAFDPLVIDLTASVEEIQEAAKKARPRPLTYRILRAEYEHGTGDNEPRLSVARIELGTTDQNGAFAETIATWAWNSEASRWDGPEGGETEQFIRLPPSGWKEIRDFLQAHKRHTRSR